MPDPSVGVVVPAYNSAQTIAATLASVLAQTRLPDRLIVVDDGSTDDTAIIAGKVLSGASVPARVLRSEHAGPSAARNRGWRAARTEWLQFLDADDVIAPTKLAAQLPVAATAQSRVALVHGPWQQQVEQGGDWVAAREVRFAVGSADLTADLLDESAFIPVAAGLVRASWLETVAGFDERHALLEDIDLFLRLAFAGARFQAVPSPEPLFFYRMRDTSLSRSAPAAFAKALARNGELVEAHFARAGGVPREVAQLLAGMYWRAAYGLAHVPHEFTDLMGRIERLRPAHNPVDLPVWRIMLAWLGPTWTARSVSLYRNARRRAGVADSQ